MIGYFSVNDRKLKKVNINGSVPVELCDVKELYGADWNEDNRIVFGDLSGNIMSIPSSGGTPESILKNESGPIIYPQILPGNNLILYTEITNPTEGNIVVQSLDSGEKKELFSAAYGAKYLHTGHIVYTVTCQGLIPLI